MAKVLGLGGVFLKADDPEALAHWYHEHLGVKLDPPYGGDCFGASLQTATLGPQGTQVFSFFPRTTGYFGEGPQTAMINLVVDDVRGLLEQVRAGGGQPRGDVQEESYGTFGWFTDPEGNQVELWTPTAG